MKKIYPFIIAALFLYVITGACKKDKNDSDGTPVAFFPKIDSVIDYMYHSTEKITTYQYDSKGRVFRIAVKDGRCDSLIYSSTQILRKQYLSDGLPDGVGTYTLDSRGLAIMFDSGSKKKDRSFVSNLPERINFNRKTPDPVHLLCEYDANEYRTKETYYDSFFSGDTVTYWRTIKNGNVTIITGTSTDPDIPFSTTETFSYYTDKQNTIGDQNTGIAFLGKQNKNLYKTIIYNWNNYNPPDTTQYWYKFDSKNRVIMKYTSSTYSTYVDSTRYTYKN